LASISAEHFEVNHWAEMKKKKKESDPNFGRPRPVRNAPRSMEEKRFLYLCKEDRPPLYSQGFTEEELCKLHEASDEHFEEFEKGLKRRFRTSSESVDNKRSINLCKEDRPTEEEDYKLHEATGEHFEALKRRLKRRSKTSPESLDKKRSKNLCKEGSPSLCSHDFSEEALCKLNDALDEHKLMKELIEYLKSREYHTSPELAFKKMREDAIEYYRSIDTLPRLSFHKDVMRTMIFHPQYTEKWAEFCARNL
jgi:hypothetical protein